MTVNGRAPGFEFFQRQAVALASVFKRQQTAADSRDDFSLAADHPAGRSRRRKILQRQRIAVWTHHHTLGASVLLHRASPRCRGRTYTRGLKTPLKRAVNIG